MRKLYSILLALTLSFVMLATAVSPVMAEPADNQPVAWVNFTGTGQGGPDNDPKAFTVRPNAQINVKRLADGSSVGHMELRFLKKDYRYEIAFNVIDSSFGTDGDTRFADILATGPEYAWMPPGTYYYWWHIEDNGEPGGRIDEFSASIYMGTGTPTWPPTSVEWFPPIMGGPIAPDNIQVHITENYDD